MMSARTNAHISSVQSLDDAIRQIASGDYVLDMDHIVDDRLKTLADSISKLANQMDRQQQQGLLLQKIVQNINAGMLLEDILPLIFRDFRELIPYNRIGLALLVDNQTRVRARWARSDADQVHLGVGYTGTVPGSSLENIMRTGQPRIINDLEEYARARPVSESTELILREGVRSSLTCPLIVAGTPIGFLFFSSFEPNTYRQAHGELFMKIAESVAVAVERSRLITELTEQAAAIEHKNAELQQANDQKNGFLGMAAHDLRNPLGVISMATELLEAYGGDMSPDELGEITGDIRSQVQYMIRLLDDLLDLTRIESGRLNLSLAPVELDAFLDDAITRHSNLARPKGTAIFLQKGIHGRVLADEHRLRQVLDNLLSNAIKYSPGGSQINVRARRQGELWRIEVEDHGPGITEEDQARLFKEFSRLNNQPTNGEKSTGLGLAITRRVVEAHGGEIGVESVPGLGSTFWFTVPQAKDV